MKRSRTVWTVTGAVMVMFLVMTGCSGLSSGPGGPGPGDVSTTPNYYGFSDVLVPGELTEDIKNSYIVQSQGFSAGVLSFRGRIDRTALIAFFRENMTKDNWKTIGSFASSRTILLFQKENRFAVISIADGDFYTQVEIGVIPMVSETGTTYLQQ